MDFDEYSILAHKNIIYPADSFISGAYIGLAVNGEAGELAEKIKKVYRDKDGIFDAESRFAILKEAGDVLWYLNELALLMGSSLNEIAEINIQKLYDRAEHNTLHGVGDNR